MFARAARLAAVSAVLLVAIAGCSVPLGPSSFPAGSGPLVLPAAIGDYAVSKSVCVNFGDSQDRCESNADAVQVTNDAAADNLSAAYGGAPAASLSYALDDLSGFVTLYAVRAASQRLWTPESDASTERLGLGHAREWIEQLDAAQCLVHATSMVPKGATLDPANVAVVRCQETGDGLTVILDNPSGTDVDAWLANTHAAFESVKSGH